MHSSVSTHLTYYYKQNNQYFTNIDLYMKKVGYFKDRIENLFFATFILLRAFNRYYPGVQKFPSETGNFFEDLRAKERLDKISKEIYVIKDHYFDD